MFKKKKEVIKNDSYYIKRIFQILDFFQVVVFLGIVATVVAIILNNR